MVRMGSVAALPMVFASESVLMQSQATSEGALALDSANVHMMEALHSGSSRVQKMQQNTQAMEEQYRSILQNIVDTRSLTDPKTGTPYIPNDEGLLDTVEQQFTNLKTSLSDEKDNNQKILTDALAAVAATNTRRQDQFEKAGTGVEALMSAMKTARVAHKDCRVQEDSDISNMESKCETFQNFGSKCDVNQDWYAQYNDDSIAVSAENTLKQVVDSAVLCKAGVDTLTSKANDCDAAQTSFKGSYCKYEKELRKVCENHKNTYALEISNLATSTDSVKALEKEQKIIWKMIGKVDCYLKVLIKANKNNMPTQQDITECAAADIATTELDITYDKPADPDECLQNTALEGEHALPTYRPGKGTWYTDEMTVKSGDLTQHSKLNQDVNCA